MHLRQLAWTLEEKLWARRSYRRMLCLNAGELLSIQEGAASFGGDAQQVLFWCAPQAPTLQQRPVIFFIHGGGWQSGDPAWHRFVGRHLAQQGYLVILVGYRLAPQSIFPAPLADVSVAVETGLALARGQGWTGPAVLVGQSAGAHLAALLVYGRRHLLPTKSDPPVAGLVLLGGPLSFAVCNTPALQRAIRTLAGPAGEPASLDPLRYVTGSEGVSVLCVHGAKDYLVPVENSVAFISRVNATGGTKGELMVLRRYHHADLLELLYEPSPEADRVRQWFAARA
jgi:acetyl esterase/lipase